jgi:hypothetical protein
MTLMNTLNSTSIQRSFWGCSFIFIVLAIACSSFSPRALGTDLDGVLANGNTADGSGVLISLTTGVDNSGFGFQALGQNSSGNYNTAYGFRALYSNTTGSSNTANGVQALSHNSGGSYNTATGYQALISNTTGPFNTAMGESALHNNTTGDRNTAVGDGALFANSGGASNTAVGVSALRNNVNGAKSTAVGHDALSQNNANDNTAIGYQALLSNTGGTDPTTGLPVGIDNTTTGFQALYSNKTGYYNTAVGAGSLFHNNGNWNTAIGNGALNSNTTGGENTVMGFLALKKNATGNSNTAVGPRALGSNTGGSWNVAIGQYAGSYITGDSNVCIGSSAYGAGGASNTTWISNIAGTAQPNNVYVTVGSDGKLGYQSSSRRYKQEIKPIDKASEAIFALQPRSFRYKSEADPAQSLDYGFVAEEVAAVNPDLAVRDGQGKIITVRYNAINAMLLNEFLKEHRKVEDQQKQIDSLKAELKEQRTFIQKVNDKVELNRPARQTVATINR